ncbi:helix-turn-helix domain-containing protein [Filimonas effusa]|uniref:Helix-turn-helix domain-containing protein n=1 Tax=Filimonas effusa TaxID=2508721 RepID=A0A4Q1DAF6_9BACT|nr:helix-turn-helix domain-containing protein [Filimonas effusa]RXK86367.1 helix-turn-helix domain-containing protein [Filimonas effusa]
MKNRIPRQLLLDNNHVQLINLNSYVHELSPVSHRHDHYMIMWITKGHGSQLIDENEYQMLTNRVFFVHPDQVHQMKDFEREGWMIIFDESIYQLYLRFHTADTGNGMMRLGRNLPYTDLDALGASFFHHVIEMLRLQLSTAAGDIYALTHLISLLFLHASRHRRNEASAAQLSDAKQLMSRLELLIESNFTTRTPVSFYASALNMDTRNLNRMVKKESDFTVHELVEKRLLTESKILLASSALTVKEISYQLGFADPAYFNRFFRKYMNVTPVEFRRSKTQV